MADQVGNGVCSLVAICIDIDRMCWFFCRFLSHTNVRKERTRAERDTRRKVSFSLVIATIKPLPVKAFPAVEAFFFNRLFCFLLFKGQALGRTPCPGRSYRDSLREGNITWLCLVCEGRFKGGPPAFFSLPAA